MPGQEKIIEQEAIEGRSDSIDKASEKESPLEDEVLIPADILNDSAQSEEAASSEFQQSRMTTFQEQVRDVHVSDALVDYVQDIIDYTRTSPVFHIGLSPRAGLYLLRAARSWAFILGRDFVLPEDVQKLLPFVLGHRLRRVDGQGEVAKDELMEMLLSVPVVV